MNLPAPNPPPWPFLWRLYAGWAVIRSCSALRVGRAVIHKWHFVARGTPHVAVASLAALSIVLYLAVTLSVFVRPALFSLDRTALVAWFAAHPIMTVIAYGASSIIVAICLLEMSRLVVNTALLIDHVFRLPFQLVGGMHAEMLAGRQAFEHLRCTFAPWLDEGAIIKTYRAATAKESPTAWQSLTTGDLLGQLLTTNYDAMRALLPPAAWGELATYELPPTALAVILRHGLNDGQVVQTILGTLTVRGAFSDRTCAPVMVRELAGLPAPKLAHVLGTIHHLDSAGQTTAIRSLFEAGQRLGTPGTGRFVEAIGLVPLAVCEAALAAVPESAHSTQ